MRLLFWTCVVLAFVSAGLFVGALFFGKPINVLTLAMNTGTFTLLAFVNKEYA